MERYSPFFSVTVVTVLAIVAAIGHAASLSPEAYWQMVLPNTPMPNYIRESLRPGLTNEKKGTSIIAYAGYINYRANVKDSDTALFFPEKDLRPGNKLKMLFPKVSPSKKFIPRSVADATPFSSTKISDILQQFSVNPDSKDAKSIKQTIELCEEVAMKGETKICATSLESMVDFTTSKLGTHDVRALSTEVEKETLKQQYTIAPGVHKLMSSQLVVCHGEPYMYQVYYCHKITGTSAYIVPLVGEDGTRVDAVSVCHKDTSSWNPKHMAMQMLKAKPGSISICHFAHQGNIVLVQNQQVKN